MSKISRAFPAAAVCASMCFFLFAFPDKSAQSIASSWSRCIGSLLPSLFPMMVLSGRAISLIRFEKNPLTDILQRLTGFSSPLLPVFFAGLLCGYPTPAILCKSKYERGEISAEEARFASFICAGASPAFLVFFVGRSVYGSVATGLLLWTVLLVAQISVAHIFRCPRRDTVEIFAANDETLAKSVARASKSCSELFGFVIFFSLAADMAKYILGYTPLPCAAASFLAGLIEITGGIRDASGMGGAARDAAVCILSATGGASVYFQTASVLSDTGIGMKNYISSRLLVAIVMCAIFPSVLKILRSFSLLP